MSTKVCSKCNVEKPLSEYGKHVRKKDGIRSSCKDCEYHYNLIWRNENRERVKESKKIYREKNKEKLKESKKIYREKNKEKLKESKKIYREKLKELQRIYSEKNKELKIHKEKSNKVSKEKYKLGTSWVTKICNTCKLEKTRDEYYINCYNSCKECEKLRQKKYRENNPIKRKETKIKWIKNNLGLHKKSKKEYVKRRLKRDPIYRSMYKIRTQFGGYVRSKGWMNTESFERILGTNYDGFRNHIEKQFKEGMTWDNHSIDGWHIDHIIPLSSGKTIEELEKLSHYTNLQPMWCEDNLKKSNKIL